MHHLHEHTLPCYHESLYNVLAGLQNDDLRIATQIFLRRGHFPREKIFFFFFFLLSATVCDSSSFPVHSSPKKRSNTWVPVSRVSGFEPKPYFMDKSQRLYGSGPAVLKSLQQVNDWVCNATNGKMPQFLSELPPNLLIMLINAVHFKGISETSDTYTCRDRKRWQDFCVLKVFCVAKRRVGSSI